MKSMECHSMNVDQNQSLHPKTLYPHFGRLFYYHPSGSTVKRSDDNQYRVTSFSCHNWKAYPNGETTGRAESENDACSRKAQGFGKRGIYSIESPLSVVVTTNTHRIQLLSCKAMQD